MDSSPHRKTDPSVLLKNEIEILLTQIHLMELYIKQAQATAANEAARHREEQQAELLALRAELERKEQELKQRQAEISGVDQTLNKQLQALQTRLGNTEELLHKREHELQDANSEIRSLRERMTNAESEIRARDAATHEAEGLRQELQLQLVSLRNDFESKNAELLQFEAIARVREDNWNGQLNQLQALLTEKQGSLQAKEGELERAKAEIARLAQRVSDLELAAGEARAAARELELSRAKFQTDLDALHAELQSKEEALQVREGAVAARDALLKGQIDDLRRELSENQELLDRRQRQLQDFQSQTVVLHERMATLEAENQRAVANAATELESARTEAAAELAQLRGELDHKERLLAEHQSAVKALEQSNQDRLRALQQELTEKEISLETGEIELKKSKAEISALLGRITEIEASQKETQSLATRELEQTRESLRAGLANLQAQIGQKEHALQDREAQFAETERLLQAQIADLRNLFDGKRQELEGRERELQDFRSQLHDQQETNRELNSANERSKIALAESESLRQGLESDLSNLRNDIGQKKTAFAEREAGFAAAEHGLEEQVQELQSRLLERQGWLESRDRELERAQSEAAGLRAQISQLEIAVRTAGSTASLQTEQVRTELQSDLVELQAALKTSEGLLQEREAAFASIENNLNSALDRLRTELSETQSLRDREHTDLEQARSEISALRQQNSESELLHKQTAKLVSVQGEQIRERVRTEIEALEAQLRERDAGLLATRSRFNELQGNFETKINELQCQLAEAKLLNDGRAAEIDDLKSQVDRLREQSTQEENSLQQTEAALNREIARLQQNHDEEIATLREELRRNRAHHEKCAASFETSEKQLLHELSDLRAQLTEKENLVDGREHDLGTARGELAAAYEKLTFLESSHRQEKEAALRETNRTEAALRAELTAKDRALEEHHESIERLEDQYRGQTDGLHDQVTDLRRLLDIRGAELEEAKAGTEALRQRVVALEAAVDEIEQTKREAQAAVATLQAELTLSAKTLREQELTAERQDHVLQSEITALQTVAKEKHVLLESRNEELVRVKAELDALQERLTELESSAKRAEEATASENENMRTELQAQIAYLQAELSQKDWALAERQGARRAETKPYLQHRESSTQRGMAPGTSEKRDNEFVLGEPRITETREERLQELDEPVTAVKTEDGQRFAAVHPRRWHSGWRWKRRWKT